MSSEHALARTLLLTRDFVGAEHHDDRILCTLQSTTVCIVADANNLNAISGQSAVAALSSLVLQMGCALRLAFGEVELRGHQPPLRGAHLRSGIIELAGDLLPGNHAAPATTSCAGDLVFVIGDTRWAEGRALARAPAWRLIADAWAGGTCNVRDPGRSLSAQFPIGALAAAAVGAAEVYKYAIRSIARPQIADQLAFVQSARVRLGDASLTSATCDFGAIDCISAGAIAQAAAHALFRVPGVCGSIRVIEPDVLDLTNLNRYALARRSQLGLHKTAVISENAPPSISICEVRRRADASNMSEIGMFRDNIIVGTDDIPSRWFVQSHRPRWLAVGATSHFLAVSSEHDAHLACARCMHPRDDEVNVEVPTVSFTSYWAGLMVAARLLRHAAGVGCADDEQALWLPSLNLNGRSSQQRHRVARDPACNCAA